MRRPRGAPADFPCDFFRHRSPSSGSRLLGPTSSGRGVAFWHLLGPTDSHALWPPKLSLLKANIRALDPHKFLLRGKIEGHSFSANQRSTQRGLA